MDNWQFKQYNLDSYHIDIVGYISPKNTSEESTHEGTEKTSSMWSELSQEQKDYYNLQRAGFRAKSKIRRTIIKYNMRYMWTLTFATKHFKDGNGNLKDAGNLDDVWKVWKAFIKRCKRKGLEFPYIVVLEVQEKREKKYNEKVYHFHFCTSTFIYHSHKVAAKFAKAQKKKDKAATPIDVSINMADLWGHGYVYATNFKDDTKQAAAAYLTKYVTKAFEEIEGKGVNRYRISQGLPVEGHVREESQEVEMDEVVYQMAKDRNCFWRKSYHCIDGGQTEILIYTIFPRSKKKKQLVPEKQKTKKRWKSLEKSAHIKTNSEGEKKKCQSTIKYLQLKAF